MRDMLITFTAADLELCTEIVGDPQVRGLIKGQKKGSDPKIGYAKMLSDKISTELPLHPHYHIDSGLKPMTDRNILRCFPECEHKPLKNARATVKQSDIHNANELVFTVRIFCEKCLSGANEESVQHQNTAQTVNHTAAAASTIKIASLSDALSAITQVISRLDRACENFDEVELAQQLANQKQDVGKEIAEIWDAAIPEPLAPLPPAPLPSTPTQQAPPIIQPANVPQNAFSVMTRAAEKARDRALTRQGSSTAQPPSKKGRKN